MKVKVLKAFMYVFVFLAAGVGYVMLAALFNAVITPVLPSVVEAVNEYVALVYTKFTTDVINWFLVVYAGIGLLLVHMPASYGALFARSIKMDEMHQKLNEQQWAHEEELDEKRDELIVAQQKIKELQRQLHAYDEVGKLPEVLGYALERAHGLRRQVEEASKQLRDADIVLEDTVGQEPEIDSADGWTEVAIPEEKLRVLRSRIAVLEYRSEEDGGWADSEVRWVSMLVRLQQEHEAGRLPATVFFTGLYLISLEMEDFDEETGEDAVWLQKFATELLPQLSALKAE